MLLAVILNEDPVAASSAAKALGLLGSHPRARDVANLNEQIKHLQKEIETLKKK